MSGKAVSRRFLIDQTGGNTGGYTPCRSLGMCNDFVPRTDLVRKRGSVSRGLPVKTRSGGEIGPPQVFRPSGLVAVTGLERLVGGNSQNDRARSLPGSACSNLSRRLRSLGLLRCAVVHAVRDAVAYGSRVVPATAHRPEPSVGRVCRGPFRQELRKRASPKRGQPPRRTSLRLRPPDGH